MDRAKNERRIALIHRKYDVGLTPQESAELWRLQDQVVSEVEAETGRTTWAVDEFRDWIDRLKAGLGPVLLAVVLSLACMSGCTPSGPPAPPGPPPPPIPPGAFAQSLLDACNSYRASRGLPTLALDSRLVTAASGHASRMAAVGKMAHVGIGDGDPFSRIQSAGYGYSAAGECVAWGQLDAASVLRAWQSDPPHRAILEGPYADCGGSGVRGQDGGIYWCMDFGRTR